jgi:hypothetical protein
MALGVAAVAPPGKNTWKHMGGAIVAPPQAQTYNPQQFLLAQTQMQAQTEPNIS